MLRSGGVDPPNPEKRTAAALGGGVNPPQLLPLPGWLTPLGLELLLRTAGGGRPPRKFSLLRMDFDWMGTLDGL